MPISISADRKPQADGKVQLPPPAAAVATQQLEQRSDGRDDVTTEPPAGNE